MTSTHLSEQARERGERREHRRKQLLMLRGLRECGDEPAHNVRRARMIAHALEHYPVVIDEDDLLVGKLSADPLTDDETRELEVGWDLLAEEGRGLRYKSGGVGGHRTVDFETLLRLGVNGILAEVGGRAGADPHFPEACRITLEALLRFAERYRTRVLELRDATDDPQRRAQWFRVAEALDHVPAHPPRTFFEALQSVWLLQVALTFDDTSCTGHPDRYLWPFYQQDIESGRLTRDEALRLIEDLYLRSNEVFGDWPETIMVGGTDSDGDPVLNDLTTLCIEAIETVGLINPNVALCYRDDTPQDLLELCLDKTAKGFSHPALYNDAVITAGLIESGLSEQDARYYQNSTCVEITPVGTSNVQPVMLWISPVKALECLLNGGLETVEDPRFTWSDDAQGPTTECRNMESFDELFDAFRSTLRAMIERAATAAIEEERRRATRGSCPLVSCFVKDCIDRGLDVAAGGARYNYCGANTLGFSTAVDSLCGIREAVYRRRLVSLDELAEALRSDFADHESLRRFLLNECPKYGNDDEDADAVARDLHDCVRRELAQYRTPLGGGFHLGCFSGWGGTLGGRRVSASVSAGAYSGSSADGRRAGEPLSENLGPAPGADVKGLTALVNSVTKLDHRCGLGGISINWRLSPSLLKDKAGRDRILDTIRVFMSKGGFELQLNAVTSDILHDAKRHPERHRNLTVRIAGYSEYFCRIGEAQQDAIIARTEYEETN